MSINVSARKHRLLIGTQDWSNALVEASNWQSSPIDGSGLVKTTATITLIETRDNPGSLDDRVNNTWGVGQTITIDVTNSLGTLTRHPAGVLRILSAQYSYEERKTTINCGCLITLLSFKAPTDTRDAQIDIVNSTSRNTLVTRLLNKAGITFIHNPYNLPYPINYPINIGSSYLETVGKLLYSAGFAAYINKNEAFEIFPISLNGSNAIALTIGGDDGDELWYRRLSSAEGIREIVEVTGGAQAISTPSYPRITTSKKYGSADIVDPNLGNFPILLEYSEIKEEYENNLITTTSDFYRPYSLVIPSDGSTVFGRTALVLAERKVERKQFESTKSGKLLSIVVDVYKTFGEVLAEYIKAFEESDEDNTFIGKANRFLSFQSFTNYKYDNKDRPSEVKTLKYETIGALLSGINEDWSQYTNTPVALILSETQFEKWTAHELPTTWSYSNDATKCKSRLSPGLINPEMSVSAKTAQLPDPNTSIFQTSNSGQTVPPAPERAPSKVGFSSVQVCGYAQFTQHGGNFFQERKRVYQIDFLQSVYKVEIDYREDVEPDCDNFQCQAIARSLGKLLQGRAKGQDIGLELKDSFFNWKPLMPLAVTEPSGTIRHFACDDAHWALSPDKTYCSMGCIWLGDGTGTINSVSVSVSALAAVGATNLSVAPTSGFIPAHTVLVIGGVQVVTATDTPTGSTTIQIVALSSAIDQGSDGTYTQPILDLPYIPDISWHLLEMEDWNNIDEQTWITLNY